MEDQTVTAEPVPTVEPSVPTAHYTIILSQEEHDALWQVLDRERTAHESHGGLRGLLSLKENDADALIGLLHRVAAL